MKKIISIALFIIFFSSNISFWYNNCEPRPECEDPLYEWESTDFWVWHQGSQRTEADCADKTKYGDWNPTASNCCSKWQVYNSDIKSCTLPQVTVDWNNWSTSPATSVMGISCSEDQLVNGQCKLNIYDTLGIRKSVRNTNDATSVGLFVQDVVLSATFFIGTLVTIALVVSGLMFIFAASSGKSPDKAKQWIMGSLIGLLIVVSSYVIIRLVQYIAKGF